MITIIDESAGEVIVRGRFGEQKFKLSSPEAFEAVSRAWLRAGWDTKYVYSFTWMGSPVIQLPEDMFRLQEVIYSLRPDVLIETGVAHGGSLVFYASLFKAMGRGRVIGVDIEIRPHNRAAIEAHELFPLIDLVEGDSIDLATVDKVRSLIGPNETVMVILDSKHTKDHVLAELRAYSPFVTKDFYIVAMDGIMEQVVGAPRSDADWGWNNPRQAAIEFVREQNNFLAEEPRWRFNEGNVSKRVTYAPDAFLRRVR